MKKLTKRTFALLLSLTLLAAVFPASPLPTMAETSGDYEYRVVDESAKTCEITKYTGPGGDVVIPSTLDGCGIWLGAAIHYNCAPGAGAGPAAPPPALYEPVQEVPPPRKATYNEGAGDYSCWSQIVGSYLCENPDGSLTRVEDVGNYVLIEVYDSHRSYVSGKYIAKELPIFGGFYSGTDCNFLVFGQNNPDEDDNVEVIRVVRYTKNWQRSNFVGLCGTNTTRPFYAGSLRMIESGGLLFVRTCHEMYRMPDGVKHQKNLTFAVDIPTMTVMKSFLEICNVSYGYVSHSFNQFIKVDGGRLVTADHGDGYPRSAVIYRSHNQMGKHISGGCDSVNTINYFGEIGKNYTGASIGGFEVTSAGYMLAGNVVRSAGTTQRNAYISVTDRENFTESGTRIVWLTNYADNCEMYVTTPQLVKVNDDKLLVIWQETRYWREKITKYVFVDGSGNQISEVITRDDLQVSDCQPIVVGNFALWYVTENSSPLFYSIYVGGQSATIVVRSDVTGDGVVDNMDAAKILKFDAGLIRGTDALLAAGDVTGDGAVDNMDAAKILQYDAGLISSL